MNNIWQPWTSAKVIVIITWAQWNYRHQCSEDHIALQRRDTLMLKKIVWFLSRNLCLVCFNKPRLLKKKKKKDTWKWKGHLHSIQGKPHSILHFRILCIIVMHETAFNLLSTYIFFLNEQNENLWKHLALQTSLCIIGLQAIYIYV